MLTNKKREGINRFVCDASLYVAKTPKASIKYHKPPLPIIPCGIVAYGFVGQPFSKQLYIKHSRAYHISKHPEHFVKNLPLRVEFSTLLLVFRNGVKHSLSCLIYQIDVSVSCVCPVI